MRLTPRDDSGVATIFIILCSLILLGVVGIAVDVSRAVAVTRSAQNSADAVALAMAKDCARTGSLSAAGYDRFIRTGSAIGNGQSQTLADGSCPEGFVTARAEETMDYTFSQVFGASNTDRARSATAEWGTISSANTVPITIAQCEFTPAILNGTADIYLYLDHPSPGSGCSGGPGGFGSLTDSGDDDDCLTVSVVNNGADGGTGASDHAADCFQDQFETILNNGGTVDVFVPIYSTYSPGPPTYTYTIVGYAAFRMRVYEFNGSQGDAGTLDGNQPSRRCPDLPDTPGNERCLHGDFVRFTTSQGTPGPSTDFGTYNVYLSA